MRVGRAEAATSRRCGLGLAVLAALLLPACRREAPRPAASAAPPARVAYDLAERVWTADRTGTRTVALFGTPSADPFQEGGFLRADWSAAPAPFAWLRRRAVIALREVPGDARGLVLDLEPAPGIARQAVRVFLRDAPVARVELRAGRHGYRFALPASPAGARVPLRLFFDAAADPPEAAGPAESAARRRVAARLYSLTLARPDAPVLELLAPRPRRSPTAAAASGEAAAAPLGVSTEPGAARIVQAGSGALHFFLSLPGRATLRFAPWVGAGGPAASFRVVLEPEGGRPRVVWSDTLPSGTRGPEAVVALPGAAGRLARLSFEAELTGPETAFVGWEGAKVVGAGPRVAGLLDPEPYAPAELRRADALRARLRGAHVVLVVLDAARARSFSCYGSPRRTTPEIDRLAAEGVLFERAYTPAVFTLSAMASVWTSLPSLAHHAGVTYDDALPPGPPTLAELLTAAGVHAAGFVANSMAGPGFGLGRGFVELDEVHLRLGPRASALARVVRGWLRARRGREGRFFLYVHFREPHFPYDPPAPFDALFGPDAPLGRRPRSDPSWYGAINDGERRPSRSELEHLERLYDGNLAYADGQVGALRRGLDELGLLERSVVIVSADHGEALYEHGWIGHNQQVFEESTRVPLIVRFPRGAGPAGVRVRGLADLLDIAPTVADVFGLLDRPQARGFHGRTLLPAALGAAGKRATYAVSTGELRGFGLRHERFKYVRNVHFGVERLYDLEADPQERTDVAASHPVRTGYYRQELHRHVLAARRGARAAAARPRLSPEQIENLRSLGYLK